jgi:hypothetical protein
MPTRHLVLPAYIALAASFGCSADTVPTNDCASLAVRYRNACPIPPGSEGEDVQEVVEICEDLNALDDPTRCGAETRDLQRCIARDWGGLLGVLCGDTLLDTACVEEAQILEECLVENPCGGVACGDGGLPPDDAGTPMMDASIGPPCAIPEVQSGACCYRESNASQLSAPELRIAYLDLAQPPVLASPIIADILNEAAREERFNWLIRLEGADADGPVTITTGHGRKTGDSFAFAMGDADPPGDLTRWDSESIVGTLTGESVTTGALDQAFTVPIQEYNGSSILELPLRGFRLVNATLSEDRSCIGRGITATRYDATAGRVEAYITVADARESEVNAGAINATLCNVLRGSLIDGAADCEQTPREMWATPPNSTCVRSGACTFGGCDAATCNAWQVVGGFAAHGVAITN